MKPRDPRSFEGSLRRSWYGLAEIPAGTDQAGVGPQDRENQLHRSCYLRSSSRHSVGLSAQAPPPEQVVRTPLPRTQSNRAADIDAQPSGGAVPAVHDRDGDGDPGDLSGVQDAEDGRDRLVGSLAENTCRRDVADVPQARQRLRRITVKYGKRFKVVPGTKVRLKDIHPGFKDHGKSRDGAADEIEQDRDNLRSLQERFYADGRRSLLICLQGLDAGGKDGTINHILGAMNPQGCRVVGFKQPSAEEAAHDFLWRAHHATPPKGGVAIFNRSHYEDVLIVRVHNLVPKDACTGPS
jgi:hypothetical protein